MLETQNQLLCLTLTGPGPAAVCTREVFEVSFDISFSALPKPRVTQGIEADTKNNPHPEACQLGQGLGKADRGRGVGETQGFHKLKEMKVYKCIQGRAPKS